MAVFDPEDFFKLGQTLAVNLKDEASQRTAIGRAYYSCHLTARDRLYGVDAPTLTNAERKKIAGTQHVGNHTVVIKAILKKSNLPSGTAKRISDQLGELKEMREQADYCRDPAHQGTTSVFRRYAVTDWRGLARAAMTLASNLLPELRRLLP